MLKLTSFIIVFVLSSTIASQAKPWDSMSAKERIAWAIAQIPRLCAGQLPILTPKEEADAKQQIVFADKATVESTIRGRCNLTNASR